jgi:hypothetical protein
MDDLMKPADATLYRNRGAGRSPSIAEQPTKNLGTPAQHESP